MKTYILFDATRKSFDDGKGGEVSLGNHLELVEKEGISYDSFDEIEAENPTRARLQAIETGLHLHIVDEEHLRVIGIVNDPERVKEKAKNQDNDFSM
jgi:hypothetical protein